MIARLLATVSLAFLLHTTGGAQVDVCVLGHLRSIPAATTIAFAADAAAVETTFRALGPFIVVQVSVDGVTGSYVLDSGAPGLILNGSVEEVVDSARALDRFVMIGERRVGRLGWGPIRQADVHAYVLDLAHLERSLGEPIAGLIGYEQLRQLPLTIDYPRRTLTFLRKHSEAKAQGIALGFEFLGHLPLVDAEVGGTRAWLGFDTGSGVNLLNAEYLSRLGPNSAELPAMQVRGLGATSELIARRSVGLTRTSSANWMNLPYGFADLTRFRESAYHQDAGAQQLDGLLGKEWMQQRVVTIDYARRRLYVR